MKSKFMRLQIPYDLHVHSVASDGLHTVLEILAIARGKGLKGMKGMYGDGSQYMITNTKKRKL